LLLDAVEVRRGLLGMGAGGQGQQAAEQHCVF
jgi:hypothetical protein